MRYIVFTFIIFLSGCVTTDNIVEKSKFQFDFSNFIGEKITFAEPKSNHIKNFTCQVILSDNQKMFYEAKPYCRIFQKNELIAQAAFDQTNTATIEINKRFRDTELLYAEMGIFYCTEGKESLCLNTKVLYAFLMDSTLPAENYSVKYDISRQTYR